MNELEKQLAQLVQKGIEVAEKTGSFVIEQAPDLIQEFYRWHLIKNIFIAIILVLIILCLFKVFICFGEKNTEKIRYDEVKIFNRVYGEIRGVGSIILISIFSLGSIGFIINCLYNIIFILTAPKLYLIEYFIK